MAKISNAAGNAAARAIVERLHAGGMSYAEMGRRIGGNKPIDASLFSQIAKGKPKGASYVDALSKVEKGETVNFQRQKGAGTLRKPPAPLPGTEQFNYRSKKGNATILKGLKAHQNKFVKWNVKFKKVVLYRNNGPVLNNAWVAGRLPRQWTAADLIDRIENPRAGDNWKPGDARAALGAIAISSQSDKYHSASGPMEVDVYTTD